MNMASTVWAVVVAYRDPLGLKNCVIALANQTVSIEGLIVVDNDASYDVREVIAEASPGSAPVIDIVAPGRNLGSAGGFALGMENAYHNGAAWVWLHDEDDAPERDCLERLLAVRDGKIRSPRIIDPTTRKTLLYFKRMQGPLGYFFPAPPEGQEIDIAGTAGLLIHREVMQTIGFYDPRFFVGFEDYDYCLRAARAGYPVTVVDEAVVHHPDHQSLLSARTRLLENVLAYLPSFWGIIRTGKGRDFFTVRNYILLSKLHKSHAVIALEMLMSLSLLSVFKLFDPRIEFWTTLKTYLKTILPADPQ